MRNDRAVTDRIALAARNNALWCDAVCRSHGLSATMDDLAWTSPRRTPPYYPDAVTLSPDVDGHDVLARVDPTEGCSVKDSWSRLDLTGEDFARLVIGEWLWWEPADPTTVSATDTLTDGRVWRRVSSADEMSAWTRAWARDPEDTMILPTALLGEPGVHVLAARDGADDFAAGCIVNVTGPIAGVGNTFCTDGDAERMWRGAVTAARHAVGRLPLVAWEAGTGVESAAASGAERLGPLTVWIS